MLFMKTPMLLLLSVCAFSAGSLENEVETLVEYLSKETHDSTWEFYPLTKFPMLRAQHHPWNSGYVGAYTYKRISNLGSIACYSDDGTCYVGSRFFLIPDTLRLYQAQKYIYAGRNWRLIEDYVIITDFHDNILDVLTRNSRKEEFRKVELYNQ
jgi:hypothetical protein